MTNYCGPCTSNSKETEALSWCIECEEALCFTCAESHRGMKMSRHHHLADVNAVPREIKFLFEKSCPKHKALSFEYFCVDHDMLCCKECFSETHRTCKTVSSLDTASNGIKGSQSYKDAGDEINHILQTLDTLSSGHIDNKETIQQEATVIHDNIIRVKEKLIEKVESLVQQLMDELKQIKDNQLNEITGNITDIEDVITSSKAHKGAFDFTKDNGSDQQTFLLVHTTKSDINDLQDRVLNLAKTQRHVSLEFCENTTIHSCLNRLGSIKLLPGKPLCRPFLPRKLSQSQIQITSSRLLSPFTNQCELNLQRIYKNKNCDITGMAVSTDGILLLCDFANRRLIMFNSDGYYESTISTQFNPWDVAVLPGTKSAVISKRDEGCVQFVDIEKKAALQVVNVFRNRSGGLGATTDYILVGGERKIHFLNLHGQSVKSVDVEIKSASWYLAPLGNDIICCSGSIDVHVINMQTGENKSYRSENLKTPMKMATDANGNIYIVGHSSDNILRLSPNDGTFSVVLTEKDGIKHPNALCFNKDYTKLYVSNKMGKAVSVFTVNR